METGILERAADILGRKLDASPRILAVERLGPRRIALTLEWPDARRRLVLDVDPLHATLHLEPARRDEPPPLTGGFAERLAGGRLRGIERGSEPRIRRLRVATRGSGGEEVLLAEWTGRNGNLLVLDAEERVLETLSSSGPRPGEPYRAPRRDPRPLPGETDPEAMTEALAGRPFQEWPRTLARMCREVPIAAAYDALVRSGSLVAGALPILSERPAAEDPGTPRELHLYLIPRRAPLPAGRSAGSDGESAGAWAGSIGLPAAVLSLRTLPGLAAFETAAGQDLMDALARAHRILLSRAGEEAMRGDALGRIRRETARLLRLRENLLRERGAEGAGTLWRRMGEALLAHLREVHKGDRELVCPDWSAGEDAPPLHIPLDPAKTGAENAQDYFRKARRWERGEPHRTRRLAEIDRAAARLSVLASRMEDAETPPRETVLTQWLADALGFLRRKGPGSQAPAGAPGIPGAPGAPRGRKAAEQGSARAAAGARAAAPRGKRPGAPVFRPRSFTTREGWTVLVGRSNAENDYLTHRLAHPEDYWFHAHAVPGSHVVLRREGRKDNPSARTLDEAASIAAFYSKARHSGKVPVIYTLKKYVRKPRGGKPGLAVCTREKTLLVPPRDPTEGQEPEWMEE